MEHQINTFKLRFIFLHQIMEGDLQRVDRYEYSYNHSKYHIAETAHTCSLFIFGNTTEAIVIHCRRKSA